MISVIVCTYNRAETLQRMLSSFFLQRHLDEIDHELIVIDNNSRDATRSVAESHLTQPHHRYVFEPRQGLSAARNRGVLEARGQYLAFLDDDVIVGSLWLKSLADCIGVTHADAIGGRARLLIEGVQPDWLGPFFRNLLSEVNFGNKRVQLSSGQGLWGVNLTFKKSALTQAGGFDEKLGRVGTQLLGGEESALLERIAAGGGVIVYEPDAMVDHIIGPERLKWDYFSALARSSGKTRRLRDTHCGFMWQSLRIARSAIDAAGSGMRMVLHRARRSPPYALMQEVWWYQMHISYLAMRWHDLAQRIPGWRRAAERVRIKP